MRPDEAAAGHITLLHIGQILCLYLVVWSMLKPVSREDRVSLAR